MLDGLNYMGNLLLCFQVIPLFFPYGTLLFSRSSYEERLHVSEPHKFPHYPCFLLYHPCVTYY